MQGIPADGHLTISLTGKCPYLASLPYMRLTLNVKNRYYQLVHSSKWDTAAANGDIKPLCRTILDDVIGDDSKYQFGISKIFFKAGMLALLEGRRTERLNQAVILIQKNVRRRIAVRQYTSLRQAVIVLQTWCRGALARRTADGMRKERAAIRLQSVIRAWLERKKFLELRHAVVKAQSSECFPVLPCYHFAKLTIALRYHFSRKRETS